jgi:hypothetical protein
MRSILLALAVIACVAPTAADAARRDDKPSQTSRTAQSQPQQRQPVAQRPASVQRPAVTQRNTAQRAATSARTTQPRATQARATLRPGDVRTSQGGVVVRGASAATISREAAGSCTRQNGRVSCGGRSSIAGWASGLPRADNAQRECPAGTFATLARGHDDVVRCMPI